MPIGDRTSMKANPFARQGETITRIRKATDTDSMGGITDTTDTSEDFLVIFGNITKTDSQIREMGLAKIGNMKLYFTSDQDIKEEDEIIRTDQITSKVVTYRVEKITASYNNVYSIAIVRSLSLN